MRERRGWRRSHAPLRAVPGAEDSDHKRGQSFTPGTVIYGKQDLLPISMRFHSIAVLLVLALSSGCQYSPRGEYPPDVRWVGTAAMKTTDFDRRLWNGTPMQLVGELLQELPDRIDSAAEHRLARNILITMADAPPGDDDGSAFITLRSRKLMRMGDFADAAAMTRLAPDLASDEGDAEREGEAELLAGDVAMACIDLRAMAQKWQSPWIEEGVALCDERVGHPNGVGRDEGQNPGVLVRIRAKPLPPRLPNASIAELAAIGLDPKLPPARRLEAGFRAARASAIDGADFAKLLRAVPVPGRALGGPPANGAEAAALFHAIEAAGPAGKVALAERGLLSPDGGVDQVSVALAVPLLAVRPNPSLAPLSVRFARILYVIGDSAAARPWARLAERSGRGEALAPFQVLLGHAKPAQLDTWREHLWLEPGSLERVRAVVEAFGGAPSATPAHLADAAASADLAAMDAAANSQRVGETTLRALVLLGSSGPARLNAAVLGRVLADLDRVNLHLEAQALAFEALGAALLGPQVDKVGTNAHS